MKRGIITILTFMLLTVAWASESHQSVGLVLSGGGAKGIAHIGVVQALEDNDIPIDYITGTSMGAIVGSLYASGFSPAEMIALIASPGFTDWSAGKIDPAMMSLFLEHPQTPAFFHINLGRDSTQVKSVLPMSLINPIPLNMAFLDICSRFTAQCGGDFDRLFVPFRCVTSDVYAKHKVVLGKGSLADAVRMSMSFPMVFEPIELNGVPMYDGGIYDNFPVDVMEDVFRPDALIGVDVGSKDAPPTSRSPLGQLEDMIMQPNPYPFPKKKGVYIRIDLDQFSLLDFGKYQEIYDIGYRHGLEMIDSIKLKVHARAPRHEVMARREAFKARTPEVRISKVNVSGGTPGENAYIASLFRPDRRHGQTSISLPEAKEAYYRAISSNLLQNLVPTPVLQPDSTFHLNYKAVVKERYNVGLGGYISSSTNSMLFLHGGYNTLSFKGLNADLNLWLGQSYMAADVSARFYFNTRRPSGFVARAVASRTSYHETERLFYEFHAPDFIHHNEVYIKTSYTVGATRRSIVNVGLGYGNLRDKYFASLDRDPGSDDKDRGIFNLGQLYASWQVNTLDSDLAPTSGMRMSATAMGVAGRYHYRTVDPRSRQSNKSLAWLQADLRAMNYFPLAKSVSLGVEGRALLSTRKLLPTYQASIVAAEAVCPHPADQNLFNPALRANSFVTLGIEPVWRLSQTLQLRGNFHGFLPLRKIVANKTDPGAHYGRWLSQPEFFGEVRAQLTLPIGNIAAYTNYSTGGMGWNAGISIGTFIIAPGFLD